MPVSAAGVMETRVAGGIELMCFQKPPPDDTTPVLFLNIKGRKVVDARPDGKLLVLTLDDDTEVRIG